jgi:hypothetical protein
VEGTPAFVAARFLYNRALLAQAPLFGAASAAQEFFRSPTLSRYFIKLAQLGGWPEA